MAPPLLFPKRSSRSIFEHILVFVAAGLVIGLFGLVAPENLRPDPSPDYTNFYRPVAERLIEGEGLTTASGDAAVRYPPAYPLLIAGVLEARRVLGIGESAALLGILMILMAGSAVLLFSIVVRFLRTSIAVTAVVLWVTYPLNLWIPLTYNSEALFVFLLLLAVFLTMRALFASRGWVISLATLAGLTLGLATLTRAAGVFLFVFLLFGIAVWRGLSRKRKLAICCCVVLGQAVALVPWEVWLAHRTDELIVVSTGGIPSIVDGLTIGADPGDDVWLPSDVADVTRGIYESRGQLTGPREIVREVTHHFEEAPLATSKLFLLKGVHAFYATESRDFDWIIAIMQSFYLSLMLVGVVFVRRVDGPAWDLTRVLLLIVLYSWITTVLALSIVRYMVPALAMLMPLAAVALHVWFGQLRHLERDAMLGSHET